MRFGYKAVSVRFNLNLKVLLKERFHNTLKPFRNRNVELLVPVDCFTLQILLPRDAPVDPQLCFTYFFNVKFIA